MTIEYDTSHGIVYVATHFAGTIIPHVLRTWDFWVITLFHVLMVLGYYTGFLSKAVGEDFGAPHTLFSINWTDINVISAMTIYFEIFYTNHCFARYVMLYNLACRIVGLNYNLIVQLRTLMGTNGYGYSKLAVRFALVATFLNFYEVHHGIAMTGRQWQSLLDYGLLKRSEMDELVGLGGRQRSNILLLWAAEVAKEGLHRSDPPPVGNAMVQVKDCVIKMRHEHEHLLAAAALPVPFQYYHLLNSMVLFNLFLWAYAMAICESCWASLVYVGCTLIFLGCLQLADMLSDPFGDDEVDFPVDAWLEHLLKASEILMHQSYTGCEHRGRHRWSNVVRSETFGSSECFEYPDASKLYRLALSASFSDASPTPAACPLSPTSIDMSPTSTKVSHYNSIRSLDS